MCRRARLLKRLSGWLAVVKCFQRVQEKIDMTNGVRTLRSLLFLFGVLSLMAMVAVGQTETGQISGTVKDASGALVVGARVIVKSLNTGLTREAETNSVGVYTVASLRPDI